MFRISNLSVMSDAVFQGGGNGGRKFKCTTDDVAEMSTADAEKLSGSATRILAAVTGKDCLLGLIVDDNMKDGRPTTFD